MTLSRDEAAEALAEITEARRRVNRAHGYADAAPFFLLWGAIWLAANLATEFAPRFGGAAWLAGLAIGTPVTLYLAITHARRRGERIRQAGGDPKVVGLRLGLSQAVLMAFFACTVVILGPLDDRQTDAFISLFWASAYMAAGVWIGFRLLFIGAATAAAIVFGYLVLDQHFYLWMGLVAGGGLIAGGLWLRKV